jgi:hypothetical protein
VTRAGLIAARAQMWVRDVPVSCVCVWAWDGRLAKWHRQNTQPGCPWHTDQAKQGGTT